MTKNYRFHCSLPPYRRSCVVIAPVLLAVVFLAVPLSARGNIADAAGPINEGLLAGAHGGFKLRSYNDHLSSEGHPDRNASVLGVQAWIASGWTTGPIGFSGSASLFSALTLAANKYAGNMAYAGSADSWKQRGWSYPGLWDVQARTGRSLIKYGLLSAETDAHYLLPHDNRALPPTFRGSAFVSRDVPGLTLTAGSVDKVVPRGQDELQPLTTEYGRAPVSRFSYVGGTYQVGKDTVITLSGNQARDAWTQLYTSAQHSIGSLKSVQWTARVDYYHTNDAGRARGGEIRNDAYSLALTAKHHAHALTLAFQQIVSDQFFDYLGETADNRLANSMDVDYNAPHERSIQLSYTIDMRDYGMPGLKITTWGVKGWGADASNTAQHAAPGTPLHDLYWSGGEPVHGSHAEVGVITTYSIQSSPLKGATVALSLMHHVAPEHYSDPSSNIVRLMINVPLTLF